MNKSFRDTRIVLALALMAPATASAQNAPRYTAAGVRFMQGMIGHHAQALAMTARIPARTSRQDIRSLGQRIEVSQKDAIVMLRQCVRQRHKPVRPANA